MTKTLLGFVAVLALTACDTQEETSLPDSPRWGGFGESLELNVELEAFANADVQLTAVRQLDIECWEGMVLNSEYTLSYPICLPPLPGWCTDTYLLIEQCIDGQLQTISNDLIEHDCEYSYDGSTCG